MHTICSVIYGLVIFYILAEFVFVYCRCDISYILLEMDRILRPEGTVIFRDTVEVLVKIKAITDGMRWKSQIMDHESGPFNPEKILVAVKNYWTGEATQKKTSTVLCIFLLFFSFFFFLQLLSLSGLLLWEFYSSLGIIMFSYFCKILFL